MRRRKTTVGRGAFGHNVPAEQHATEILHRILSTGKPLTEDAVFLAMRHILAGKNSSRIFQKVGWSKNVGRAGQFHFSPDVDLLEVRPSGAVVGYELKGYRKVGRSVQPPIYYEGLDQALALLKNPLSSPILTDFAGSVFDHTYLVHPHGSEVERLADMLETLTPIGLIVVDHSGTRELVKPKPNPYLDITMKQLFLSSLDAFSTYEEYKVNPIQ